MADYQPNISGEFNPTEEEQKAYIQRTAEEFGRKTADQGVVKGLEAAGVGAIASGERLVGGLGNLAARTFGADSTYDPTQSALQQQASRFAETQPFFSFIGSTLPTLAAGVATGGIGSGAALSAGALGADLAIGAGASALESLADPHAKWEDVARAGVIGGLSSAAIGAGTRGIINAGGKAVSGIRSKLAQRGLEGPDKELSKLVANEVAARDISVEAQRAAREAIEMHMSNPANDTGSAFHYNVLRKLELADEADIAVERMMEEAADKSDSPYFAFSDEAANYKNALRQSTEAHAALEDTLSKYSKQFRPEYATKLKEELAKNGDDVFDAQYGEGAARALKEKGFIPFNVTKGYQELISTEISSMESSLSKSKLTLDELFDMVKGKDASLSEVKANVSKLKEEFNQAKLEYKNNPSPESKQLLTNASDNLSTAKIEYQTAVDNYNSNRPIFTNEAGSTIKIEKVQQLIDQTKKSFDNSGLLRLNKNGEYSIDFKKAENILSTPEGKTSLETLSRHFDDVDAVFQQAKNVPQEVKESISSQSFQLKKLVDKNNMIESANTRAKLARDIAEEMYSPKESALVGKAIDYGKEVASNAIAGTAAHLLGPLGGFAYQPIKSLAEHTLSPLANALKQSGRITEGQISALGKQLANGAKATAKGIGNVAKSVAIEKTILSSSNFNKAYADVKGFNREEYKKSLPAYVDNEQDKEFLTSKAEVTNAYLKKQLPAVTVKNGKLITSQYEQEKFQKIVNAVNKPDSVINKLVKNDQSVTKSEVDAIATIYPIYFNSIRESVINGLNEAEINNVTIPSYRKQQLDLLFDLDGSNDKFLSSGLNEKIQMATAAKAQEQIQPPPQRILANKPVKSFDSPSEQFLD